MATTPSPTVTDLLAELVRFKTTSGDNAEAANCLDYVEEFVGQRGMQVQRHVSQGFPSLVATSQPTKTPKILLQAHMDVVPCADSFYKLTGKDGKLFGRGVYDMKFAAAVFMKVVDDLKGDMAAYDFGLMLTSDEEVGGLNGVGALLKMGYGGKVCVLPDAGDNWHIELTQKGVWIAKLFADGVAVHGSRPWEGDNAIHRILEASQEIRSLFDKQHAKSDTLSINQIQGGSAMNQVADRAEATLDIRFMSTESYEKLRAKINEVLVRYQIGLQSVACIQPVVTDMANPLVASFVKLAESFRGGSLPHIHSLGNSDAHYFAEHGIPVILMRPDGGAPHSDHEWVDRKSLERYYELIRQYVQVEARL